jgi:hypothetical protein
MCRVYFWATYVADNVRNTVWSSYKLPDILARFERNLNFLNRFFIEAPITKFREYMSRGGRAVMCIKKMRNTRRDMTKQILAFPRSSEHA